VRSARRGEARAASPDGARRGSRAPDRAAYRREGHGYGREYGYGSAGWLGRYAAGSSRAGDGWPDGPAADARDVTVTVRDGDVSLRGTVGSERTRRRLADVAETVRGVREVDNRVRARTDRPPAAGTTREPGPRPTTARRVAGGGKETRR